MSAHLAFRTSYDGRSFQGSQSQTHGKTVQDSFEKALKTIFRKDIRLQFSSRTDSGVHAYDQIFFIRAGYPLWGSASDQFRRRLQLSINSLIGPHACVWQIGRLRESFNPKDHMEWKEYSYSIFECPYPDPLLDDRSWWIRKPLDLALLTDSLKSCEGKHDFSALSKPRSIQSRGESGTIRRIIRVDLKSRAHRRFSEGKFYEIRIRGEGFLHQMVRRIVGTSVQIASGEGGRMSNYLQGGRAPIESSVAPAHALVLTRSKVQAGFYSAL